MADNPLIETFLTGRPHAVVGASVNRTKYGNKVLRAYLQSGRDVYPVHPNEPEIEGITAYPELAAIPEKVHGISIITPPSVTEKIVEQAVALKINHLWMQPGAESDRAIDLARSHHIQVIAGGECLLVVIGFIES